jgi:hypothetical protein
VQPVCAVCFSEKLTSTYESARRQNPDHRHQILRVFDKILG